MEKRFPLHFWGNDLLQGGGGCLPKKKLCFTTKKYQRKLCIHPKIGRSGAIRIWTVLYFKQLEETVYYGLACNGL